MDEPAIDATLPDPSLDETGTKTPDLRQLQEGPAPERDPGASHSGTARLGVGHIDQAAMFNKIAARLGVVGGESMADTLGGETLGDGSAGVVATRGMAEGATHIDRFRIVRRLGAGGMGVVYLAHDPELDRPVALKYLHPRFSKGHDLEVAAERMRREARAMARLAHPNVVHIHEVGRHRGQLFLAMEFIDGHTLSDWMMLGQADGGRGWQTILDVFCQAGDGLDAAHKAGLVHRDFKPDNVLIGHEGAVKVTDFGLASAALGEQETDIEATARDLHLREKLGIERSSGLGSTHAGSITVTGSLLGTPMYMSPEQFLGAAAGAPSDQFSFCVALYEALYGAHPFGGKTLEELRQAVTLGRYKPPPGESDVPGWVAPILARGLSGPPSSRWPSMEALLTALRDDPVPRRRRRIALGCVGLVVAGSIAGYAKAEYDRAQVIAGCRAAGDAITEVWSPDHHAPVRAAILATGASFAASTAERTIPRLDDYAARWRETRTALCLATEVQGRWRPELVNAATACMDQRRERLARLASRLEDPGAGSHAIDLIQNAVSGATHLPDVATCTDQARLASRPPEPEDEPTRAEIRRLRAMMAEATTLDLTRRYEESLALMDRAQEAAKAIDWPPIQAAVSYHRGVALSSMGRFKEAEAAHEDAFFTAGEVGADERAVNAAMRLVWVVGYRLNRPAEGLRWARACEMMMGRLDPAVADSHRYSLLDHIGSVKETQGDYPAAIDHYERSLEISARVRGPDHPNTTTALLNLAESLRSVGELDRALEIDQRAVDILENALGPDHPRVAGAIQSLAGTYGIRGDYAKVIELMERALAILEPALGPDHVALSDVLMGLGIAHAGSGDSARALPLLTRVVTIIENVMGPDHPDLAPPLVNLATVYAEQENLEAAEPLFRRALTVVEDAQGKDHPTTVYPLVGLATLYTQQGDHDRAGPLYQRLIAGYEALDPDHPELVGPLGAYGVGRLALGDRDGARALFERAIAIATKNPGEPAELAQVRFGLAQLLVDDPAERDRALGLTRQAREVLAATPDRFAKELREVDAWLTEHTAP